ncbi:MAG: T9SS type A sorting domain-containing protein [Bacteroidetes bacterium]|jgi:hypothetical protein|nr:T9SS type A sorting domain-containing protein [Bacteroidota bacterium]
MTKISTFFLLIALSINLQAQTLDYANYSNVLNTVQHIRLADNSSFNTAWYGTTGNGVTWNASSITPMNGYPLLSFSYYNPSITPYAALYPSANYSFYDPALTTLLDYEYYNVSSDSVVLEGSYSPSTAHEIFQNGDKRLIFPFIYGQTFTDNYEKTNYSNATTVSSYQNGTRTVSFNGYGTLILPQATFNNVALISETRTNNLGPDSYIYTWIDLNNGHTLMMYSVNGSFPTSAFTTDIPTGIQQLRNESVLSVYPNPSSGIFTIQAPQHTDQVRITSSEGKTIYNSTLNSDTKSISLKAQPGIYFIHTWEQNHHSVKKLIIQ